MANETKRTLQLVREKNERLLQKQMRIRHVFSQQVLENRNASKTFWNRKVSSRVSFLLFNHVFYLMVCRMFVQEGHDRNSRTTTISLESQLLQPVGLRQDKLQGIE